ncbi:MAG: hypothetical protein ACJ79K_12880 [Gemmatimonadaceae bacterium]
MPDDIDRASVTPVTPVPAPRRRKRWWWRILAVLVLGPVLVIGLWIAITLNYTFSSGERAGYVQKFSRKGWICKTWEGELAMATIPGTMPEIFSFTVRNDSVARVIERDMGRRVSLSYEQHRGVPTTCFGETEYFVTAARSVDDPQFAPPTPPAQAAPVATPAPAAPGAIPR